MAEASIHYFENSGEENTQACVDIVKRQVEENGYHYVVVASRSGNTGIEFAKALKDLDCELYVVRYAEGNGSEDDIPEEQKSKLASLGCTYFSSPSISVSLDGSFSMDMAPMEPSKVIYTTLRLFGEGMKVCCEVAMLATDKGLISQGVEAIAVGGNTNGADTVAVVKATSSLHFRELKVLEILAKPRDN